MEVRCGNRTNGDNNDRNNKQYDYDGDDMGDNSDGLSNNYQYEYQWNIINKVLITVAMINNNNYDGTNNNSNDSIDDVNNKYHTLQNATIFHLFFCYFHP